MLAFADEVEKAGLAGVVGSRNLTATIFAPSERHARPGAVRRARPGAGELGGRPASFAGYAGASRQAGAGAPACAAAAGSGLPNQPRVARPHPSNLPGDQAFRELHDSKDPKVQALLANKTAMAAVLK